MKNKEYHHEANIDGRIYVVSITLNEKQRNNEHRYLKSKLKDKYLGYTICIRNTYTTK